MNIPSIKAISWSIPLMQKLPSPKFCRGISQLQIEMLARDWTLEPSAWKAHDVLAVTQQSFRQKIFPSPTRELPRIDPEASRIMNYGLSPMHTSTCIVGIVLNYWDSTELRGLLKLCMEHVEHSNTLLCKCLCYTILVENTSYQSVGLFPLVHILLNLDQ